MHALSTLRVLLPSWRFFDDVAGSPALWVRYAASSEELGPWRPASHAVARSPSSMFFNPHGNLALAHHTLLERLLSDVADMDDRLEANAAAAAVEQLVAYRLVTRLAKAQVPTGAVRFQFRLTLPTHLDEGEPHEDVLISSLHEG